MKSILVLLAAGAVIAGASDAGAEPMFLAKQYTRCTTCHYSATGGGLLTPYGRSVSHQELSTWGGDHTKPAQPGTASGTGEEAFLYGVLGDTLGPVQLGIDLRPGRLQYWFEGTSSGQNILMTADLLAAYQKDGWTLYGEIGRKPDVAGGNVDSYEYWASRQWDTGFGFRAGRFLPAYGINFADHTAFNRAFLGFDVYDQVYGVEVSQTTDHYLLQASVSPGRADSIINNDGTRAFTTAGRLQFDLTPRTFLVASGLYRGASQVEGGHSAVGLALGFAPFRWLSVQTEGDAQFQRGADAFTDYVVVNETAFEVVRGMWFKFSPQFRTSQGSSANGVFRTVYEADLLPRTHWNVDVSYYRDDSRSTQLITHTLLAQIHLYL